MPSCRNCGNETGEGNTFCPKCGERLAGFTEEETQRYINDLQDSIKKEEDAERGKRHGEEQARPQQGDTPSKTANSLTRIGKGALLAGVIVILVAGAILCAGPLLSPEIAPFSEQAVTVESVQVALNELSGTAVELGDSITDIKVYPHAGTETPDDYIVHVYFKPDSIWDAAHAMEIAVHTSITAMEALFQNEAVAEVVMWEQLDFTDKYGNTETETAVRIVMSQATANQIVDWEVVADRAWSDYNTFFDLADLQFVHPAIAREIE